MALIVCVGVGKTGQRYFLEHQQEDRVSALWIFTTFPLARKEK